MICTDRQPFVFGFGLLICVRSGGGDATNRQMIRAGRIIRLAIVSRALVWCIALLARTFVPPYDTSALLLADADRSAGSECASHSLDRLVRALIDGFDNWDGVHMIQISLAASAAEHDPTLATTRTPLPVAYEHEKQFFFFPLLPALTTTFSRWVGVALNGVGATRVLCRFTIHKLVAFAIANTAFVVAATALYALTLRIFAGRGDSESIAYRSSVLFCFGPASVFMSAAYSESLFAALTFTALYFFTASVQPNAIETETKSGDQAVVDPPTAVNVIRRRISPAPLLQSVVPVQSTPTAAAVDSLTHPFAFDAMWARRCVSAVLIAAACLVRSNGLLYFGYFAYAALRSFSTALGGVNRSANERSGFVSRGVCILVIGAIAVSPFFWWQSTIAQRLCSASAEAATAPYCVGGLTSLLRTPYDHIQSKYWHVGWFKYYTAKQAPNFALSAPVLILSLCGIYQYATANWNRVWSIGGVFRSKSEAESKTADANASANAFVSSNRAFVFVVHWTVLIAICFTVLHGMYHA